VQIRKLHKAEILMNINKNDNRTRYSQIKAAIQDKFFSGSLNVGDRLPSEREMAKEFKTSALTVSRVLDEYVREGVLSREPRRGTFIRSIPYDRTRRISIGVVLLTPQYPETQDTAVAILQFAKEQNVMAELVAPGDSLSLIADYVGQLCRNGCGGLLAGAIGDEAMYDVLRDTMPKSMPLVLFRGRGDLEANQVYVSEEKGGYAGTKALIEMGHKRIMMLAGNNLFEDRACGYRRALSEAGLPVYEHFIRKTSGTMASGYEAMSSALIGDREYSAVFCHNDFVAMGAIEAIRRAGLRVPEDVSVMGFDELAPSGSRDMGLSTVSMRKIEIAQHSLALLLELIQKEDAERSPQQIEFEPKVVVGETTTLCSMKRSSVQP
jgi:DNA-binding LacI/PurR family transcriptional regulator